MPFACQCSPWVGEVACAFQDRTPTVQGAMGLPRMCTEPMAEVRSLPLWSCTDPYSGCTKMPFARESSSWIGEVVCAFSGSYTYCTRCYGTTQDVYRAYG